MPVFEIPYKINRAAVAANKMRGNELDMGQLKRPNICANDQAKRLTQEDSGEKEIL